MSKFKVASRGARECLLDGEPAGEIVNDEIAKALWSIWFSDNAVVDRNALVSTLK